MKILKLLSEEVFDFARLDLTQAKTKELKQTLTVEFKAIHELCVFVLNNTRKPELIRATLETLSVYLTWVPLGYIFEGNLLEMLLQLFPQGSFRNVALQCLTEVRLGCLPAVAEGQAGDLGCAGGSGGSTTKQRGRAGTGMAGPQLLLRHLCCSPRVADGYGSSSRLPLKRLLPTQQPLGHWVVGAVHSRSPAAWATAAQRLSHTRAPPERGGTYDAAYSCWPCWHTGRVGQRAPCSDEGAWQAADGFLLPPRACLYDPQVGSLQMSTEFNPQFAKFYDYFMRQLVLVVPPSVNIPEAYEKGTDEQQKFVQNLALFFTSFFKVGGATMK